MIPFLQAQPLQQWFRQVSNLFLQFNMQYNYDHDSASSKVASHQTSNHQYFAHVQYHGMAGVWKTGSHVCFQNTSARQTQTRQATASDVARRQTTATCSQGSSMDPSASAATCHRQVAPLYVSLFSRCWSNIIGIYVTHCQATTGWVRASATGSVRGTVVKFAVDIGGWMYIRQVFIYEFPEISCRGKHP